MCLNVKPGLRHCRKEDYLTEVHLAIIATFNAIMMELEVRLDYLNRDFAEKVDSMPTAILIDKYLFNFQDELMKQKRQLEDIMEIAADVAEAVSDEIYLPALPEYVPDDFDAIYKKVTDIAEDMGKFYGRHKADLDNVKRLFGVLDKLFTYMNVVISDDVRSCKIIRCSVRAGFFSTCKTAGSADTGGICGFCQRSMARKRQAKCASYYLTAPKLQFG
jgi:hypothetical protein